MTLTSMAVMTRATMPTSRSLIPNGPSATAQVGSLRGGASTDVMRLTASRYAMTGPDGKPGGGQELRARWRQPGRRALRLMYEARRKRDAEPRSMPGYG